MIACTTGNVPLNYLFAESHATSCCIDANIICGIFLVMTFVLRVLRITVLVKVISGTLGERRGT